MKSSGWLVALVCWAGTVSAQGQNPEPPAVPPSADGAERQPEGDTPDPKPEGDTPDPKPEGEPTEEGSETPEGDTPGPSAEPSETEKDSEEPKPEKKENDEEDDIIDAPDPEPVDELPPLPPATPEDQSPRPFFPDGIDRRARHVIAGPDFGVMGRPSSGEGASYDPGFTWGLHARVEAFEWLGFRAQFLKSRHSINLDPNVFPGGEQVDVNLTAWQMSLRAEPTWVFAPRARAWVGVGVGWTRLETPDLELTGLTIRKRQGVNLEYPFEIGASYDVIPHWLAVNVLFSAAPLTRQSGEMFERMPLLDQTGAPVEAAPLPKIDAVYGAFVGVGAIL